MEQAVPQVLYCGPPRGKSQGENPVGTVEVAGPNGEGIVVHFYGGHRVRVAWKESGRVALTEFYAGTSKSQPHSKVVLERAGGIDPE